MILQNLNQPRGLNMTDTIEHSDMVRQLAKNGGDILSGLNPLNCHILHMAVGISGEAGELLDAVKKSAIYGQSLDLDNVIEELGDIEFYLEGLRQVLVLTRAQTLEANIEKLGVRYKNHKYSDDSAKERADKKD